MAQVDEAADAAWKEYAREWMIWYLKTHPEMFTDDLWDLGLEEPREMRALGPITLSLYHQGFIEKTGRTRPRLFGHLAHGPVWRSLIYRPPVNGHKSRRRRVVRRPRP
jgi:hypothetical protein